MNYLFICRHNQARSQIAEAFFNHYYKGFGYQAKSAGVYVRLQGDTVPISVWEVMHEKGYELKNHRTCKLTEDLVSQSDKIIILCEKEICPPYLSGSLKAKFWDIKDPVYGGKEVLRRTRDNIEKMILELF
jgi:arsenate reductase (thioredoxin)